MTERKGLILITGQPGIGKTTLIQKVCKDLVNKYQLKCNGFYTEEVRNQDGNKRIGFDVVTLSNKRGILSRESHNGRGPVVGKYCVHIDAFEDIALPIVKRDSGQDLLVIDEVGKMELKSKKFETSVQNCIMKTNLLVTVPYDSRQTLHLVDKHKTHPNSKTIVVTKENRNNLQGEIIKLILALTNSI